MGIVSTIQTTSSCRSGTRRCLGVPGMTHLRVKASLIVTLEASHPRIILSFSYNLWPTKIRTAEKKNRAELVIFCGISLLFQRDLREKRFCCSCDVSEHRRMWCCKNSGIWFIFRAIRLKENDWSIYLVVSRPHDFKLILTYAGASRMIFVL